VNPARWLALTGGALLLIGVVLMFCSFRDQLRVMGEAGKGVAVLASDKGSPEWAEKERLARCQETLFNVGLLLTALGVILQTAAAFVPVISQKVSPS
jgi:hypothetical protein